MSHSSPRRFAQGPPSCHRADRRWSDNLSLVSLIGRLNIQVVFSDRDTPHSGSFSTEPLFLP